MFLFALSKIAFPKMKKISRKFFSKNPKKVKEKRPLWTITAGLFIVSKLKPLIFITGQNWFSKCQLTLPLEYGMDSHFCQNEFVHFVCICDWGKCLEPCQRKKRIRESFFLGGKISCVWCVWGWRMWICKMTFASVGKSLLSARNSGGCWAQGYSENDMKVAHVVCVPSWIVLSISLT